MRRHPGVKVYFGSSRNRRKRGLTRHFISSNCRPDMVAFNKIKAATGEALLVSAITEDDISIRRAW
ncbi:UNVERIFIED_CONTAM: hypothetical protein Slati_0515200 [Sesamum latifolium]|uniref:Uncharacterized protein n=1 Tax=Sesamum latifolium TaxID=2727402 RepID=A0AAW2Y0R9_9LAMI